MLKPIYYTFRYLLAALFIFSGMIKCLDPMGTEIKLGEYLAAFSLESLTPIAAALSVVLSSLELMLGLSLLLGTFKRVTAIAVALFMTFFTILTWVIMLTNPVSDCGCFGDVVVLSNSATFYKNCVFELFSLFLLYYTLKNKEKEGAVKWYEIAVWAGVVLIPVYSYLFLPAIEVLPFKIGADINRATEHTVADTGEIVLVYRNTTTGETRKFSLDDPEWQDESQWEFVSTEEGVGGTLVNVVSFDVLDKSGNEVSESLLLSPDTLVVVVAKEGRIVADRDRLIRLIEFSERNNIPAIAVTSSEIESTESLLRELTGSPIAVYNMDETTIKTLLRAPAGVVVLSNGVVLGKWNALTLPRFDSKASFDNRIANQHNKPLWFVFFVTFVLLPLFAVQKIKKRQK